jgi:hypothetical protein
MSAKETTTILTSSTAELVPVKFFAGVSRNFITGSLVSHIVGSRRRSLAANSSVAKVKEQFSTIDIGMRLSIPVHSSVLLGVNVQRSFRSNDRENIEANVYPQMSYGIILTYLPIQ